MKIWRRKEAREIIIRVDLQLRPQPSPFFGRPSSHLNLAPRPPPLLPRNGKKKPSRPCSVCVCYALPEQRLGSRARLIVLQHPYEIRRRLATVPLLSAALESVDVLRGRRFGGEGRCVPPCLAEAMKEAAEKNIPVLLMFPGPGALDVKDVAERGIPRSVVEGRGDGGGGGEEESSSPARGAGERETTPAPATADAGAEAGAGAEAEAPPLAFGPVRGGEYILVAVDGTWHQGKQMFRVSSTFGQLLLSASSFPFFSSSGGGGGIQGKRKPGLFDADHFFVPSHPPSLPLFSPPPQTRILPPGSWLLEAQQSGSSSRSETPQRSSARRPPRPWRAPRGSGERQ